jgi:prepilin-type N-terminal cleavage/methylation domain-containing protein
MLSRPLSRRPGAALRGLTLIEVMISLGIFALVATSVVAVTFRIRSMAEQTVYQNTALVLAQGYIEQLRSLDYPTLERAAQDATGTVALALVNAGGATVADTSGGVLGNGDWSSETVFLDENANGTPIQPLQFRFQPVLTSLTTSTSGAASGVEITVNYQTTYNFGHTQTFTGSLRTVRSAIPTY